jgi:CMP-N-acetylneuraminic acid synthetase
MNASIYVWRRDALFENDDAVGPQTRLFVMPEDRSLDIDTELDFELVSFLMARQQR